MTIEEIQSAAAEAEKGLSHAENLAPTRIIEASQARALWVIAEMLASIRDTLLETAPTGSVPQDQWTERMQAAAAMAQRLSLTPSGRQEPR